MPLVCRSRLTLHCRIMAVSLTPPSTQGHIFYYYCLLLLFIRATPEPTFLQHRGQPSSEIQERSDAELASRFCAAKMPQESEKGLFLCNFLLDWQKKVENNFRQWEKEHTWNMHHGFRVKPGIGPSVKNHSSGVI